MSSPRVADSPPSPGSTAKSSSPEEKTLIACGSAENAADSPTKPRFTSHVFAALQPGQRLGIHVRDTDGLVTFVARNSPLNNQLRPGALLKEINGKPFDVAEVARQVAEPTEKKLLFLTEHAVYSHASLQGTTIERIRFNKKKETLCSRVVSTFKVILHNSTPPGIGHSIPLGLRLQYDALERVQVEDVRAGSLSAVHLRPGDIIKAINDKAIASISMAAAYIQSSMKERKFVEILVECSAEQKGDAIAMPDDVVNIAERQIDFIKSGGAARIALVPLLAKKPTPADAAADRVRRQSFVEGGVQEVRIESDVDPASLRSCKGE